MSRAIAPCGPFLLALAATFGAAGCFDGPWCGPAPTAGPHYAHCGTDEADDEVAVCEREDRSLEMMFARCDGDRNPVCQPGSTPTCIPQDEWNAYWAER